MEILLLPARIASRHREEILVKNSWGYGLKIAIRQEAKALPLYWKPVEIEPLVAGRADNGDIIPINTLGRWLFGTPGYMGHIMVEGGSANVAFRCPELPEAIELIRQAVGRLIKKEVPK